jgi:hypothetical protein
MADQDNYGNGDEMNHDNEFNGNGMEGQENNFDGNQQSNGSNENAGRDDDR